MFVPNVKLDALLKVLQEPQTDKHKQEDVLSSRVVSRDGDTQKVFLRLRRTKFVTVVYDTEYDVDYRRRRPDRAWSNSISTKVVEIENAGTPTRARACPRATIPATCGGSIPTGATSSSMTACWSRSSR